MNFMVNETEQKLRGGYYTPLDIATFLARWVKQSGARVILEPSCGDGVFLKAFEEVNLSKGSKVSAFELDFIEAAKSRSLSDDFEFTTDVVNTDFLAWALPRLGGDKEQFDGVVGNPPFIRYQYLPELFQSTAEKVFKMLGCKFTKHTNAWVPFVLASIALLKPGGRLAMVLPSELIHVLHAQSLRSFLAKECKKILIIDPEEIWFEGTLQGAVILMAEKKAYISQPNEGLGLLPVTGRSFLSENPQAVFDSVTPVTGKALGGKWTIAFMKPSVRDLLDEVETLPGIDRFKNVAEVDVGIVTGANKFFLVDDETVETFGLQHWAHKMFGRSEHCPGIIYDEAQHLQNSDRGLPSNFLWFPEGSANYHAEVSNYIRYGESQELQTRYKCRVRRCWYTVPSVYTSDIGMLKRCHDAPRLILNEAKAYTTDTAYRIRSLKQPAEEMVSAFVNPLTALSAELEGRTYGGGVLELVPSEIEKLLVVSPRHQPSSLRTLNETVKKTSMRDAIVTHGAEVLKNTGLHISQIEDITSAWVFMRNRRQRVSQEG
ncbi:N-6 DNA methylase [Pseudomonas synxantha]|uniref:Eco57I restriction-modification methylase domain-containing protein n=1 Tax=Pseudomonas synxantha TaxID=47883 RepID=UPI00236872DD|nr:N-6 DNA methylase [Pseudomonas synxantha]WDG41920.1 N-6 DNA methylase [Pseudomonas synxantha]